MPRSSCCPGLLLLILPRSSVVYFTPVFCCLFSPGLVFILSRSSVVYSAPVYCCLFCPGLVLLISLPALLLFILPRSAVDLLSHLQRRLSARSATASEQILFALDPRNKVILFALYPRNKSFYLRWIPGTNHSIHVGSKEQVILFALDPKNKSFYSR